MHPLQRPPEHRLQFGDEFQQRRVRVVREVDRLGPRHLPNHRRNDDLADVGHEREVARLRPVAVDGEWSSGQRGVDELGDHGRIRMFGGLQRPVDVEEPERESFHPVGRLVGQRVSFGRHLRDRVGAEGARPVVLADGQFGVRSVDRARRGDDDVGDAQLACRFEDVEGAGGAGVVGGAGVGDRQWDAGDCGEVHDRVDPVGDFPQQLVVEHRTFGEPHLDAVDAVEVGPGPGAQVVQHLHFVDRGRPRQRPAEVGADESGSAGDKDLHTSSPAMGGCAPPQSSDRPIGRTIAWRPPVSRSR